MVWIKIGKQHRKSFFFSNSLSLKHYAKKKKKRKMLLIQYHGVKGKKLECSALMQVFYWCTTFYEKKL